jgi:DNA-binding CsgD family transcriptional regulator
METALEAPVFSCREWLQIQSDLSLSGRQAAVVQQLFQGHSDKQIARELQISIPTVRTHLNRLFLRFGVQDRCELVLHVFGHFMERHRAHGCPCME